MRLAIRTLLGTLLVSLLALPAGAQSAEANIQDIAGDANMANGQGLATHEAIGQGIATAPASYGPADLRAIRFATTFDAIPVGDDGIDYQATGLEVQFVTEETPGSDGPTMIYRLNVSVGGCNSFLQAYLRGASSLPNDPVDKSLQWRQLDAGCPDGAVTKTHPDWTVTVSDTDHSLTMAFPFSSMTAAQLAVIGPGMDLGVPQGNTRTNFTWGSFPPVPFSGVTAPQIDETVIGEDWIIGSDVPADVPCTSNCPTP